MSPARLRCRRPGFTRRPLRSQISSVCAIAHSRCAFMNSTCRSSLCGSHRSSESRNAISGADAFATPVLRAAATPRFSVRHARAFASSPHPPRGPHAARRSSSSAVPSVEPSSTTITSMTMPGDAQRCAITEATASRTIARRLYVGMITLTSGFILREASFTRPRRRDRAGHPLAASNREFARAVRPSPRRRRRST